MIALHALGWLIGVYPTPHGTPVTYQFYSGSFIAFTLAGGWYHKNNCHRRHCPFIGRHTIDGTPWCNRHHKSARKTLEEK